MFSMTRASEKGYVYLQNGQITHAKLGEVEGEDAIYALALWSQGSFQFSPGVESEARTISRSNTNLLLEAARRSDEWKILSKKIPGTDSVPVLVAREGANGPVTLTPLEWKVVTKADGKPLDRRDRPGPSDLVVRHRQDPLRPRHGRARRDRQSARGGPGRAPGPGSRASSGDSRAPPARPSRTSRPTAGPSRRSRRATRSAAFRSSARK